MSEKLDPDLLSEIVDAHVGSLIHMLRQADYEQLVPPDRDRALALLVALELFHTIKPGLYFDPAHVDMRDLVRKAPGAEL